jgi:prevent-host-death family protein
MKTIPAGRFKAECLRIMDDVARRREPVTITKRGRPVARLVPVEQPSRNLLGCLAARMTIVGDVTGPAVPANAWKALGEWDELTE